MPPVLRSCTWIKCWHSREAQVGWAAGKCSTDCSVQHRRLCSGESWIHMTALCAESVQVQQLPAFILAEQPGWLFPTEHTLTAAWQCYSNRSLHLEWHRLSSLHSGAKTDLEQPPPSSGKAQACPNMLIALNPVPKTGLRALQRHSKFPEETKPCWKEKTMLVLCKSQCVTVKR